MRRRLTARVDAVRNALGELEVNGEEVVLEICSACGTGHSSVSQCPTCSPAYGQGWEGQQKHNGWLIAVSRRIRDLFQLGTVETSDTHAGLDTSFDETLRRLASQGDPEAQNEIGRMYDDGVAVEQSYLNAVHWYRLAAEQGNADAQYNLGIMYDTGRGVSEDFCEAHHWWCLAANQGHWEATEKRNNIRGFLTPHQIAEGQTRADALQSILGAAQEAIRRLRLAAIKGDPEARTMLGNMWNDPEVRKNNSEEVRRWHEWYHRIPEMAASVEERRRLRLAADQGDPESQFQMGSNRHQSPWDWEYNLDDAVYWYRLAAQQGHAEAQKILGDIYYTQNDLVEAIHWYRLAAYRGDIEAQNNLGRIYCVQEKFVDAARWYREAAERGDAESQSCLGDLYRDGMGVTENYVEAYKWYCLASAQDHDLAWEREDLRDRMTSEQIAEGQKLAAQWKPVAPDFWSNTDQCDP